MGFLSWNSDFPSIFFCCILLYKIIRSWYRNKAWLQMTRFVTSQYSSHATHHLGSAFKNNLYPLQTLCQVKLIITLKLPFKTVLKAAGVDWLTPVQLWQNKTWLSTSPNQNLIGFWPIGCSPTQCLSLSSQHDWRLEPACHIYSANVIVPMTL